MELPVPKRMDFVSILDQLYTDRVTCLFTEQEHDLLKLLLKQLEDFGLKVKVQYYALMIKRSIVLIKPYAYL